jgi:hypothetical protein
MSLIVAFQSNKRNARQEHSYSKVCLASLKMPFLNSQYVLHAVEGAKTE